MEFVLSKPQKGIQKAVREFARKEFEKEKVLELLRTGSFPAETRQRAGELGFCGIHFPEEHDGAGLGLTEYVLAAEEMCRTDSSVAMAVLLAGCGAECLFRFGTSGVAEKYLPQVSSGKMRCCAAFFENTPDTDPAGIKTSARGQNGGFVINGTKTFAPNGNTAGFYVVLCRTESPDNSEPENGFCLAAVDAGAEGISARPSPPTLGGNLIDFADVSFENVKIPENCLLGKPGRGLFHADEFINELRIQTAAMALGTAQGAFERALDYVKKRSQFGKKLTAFQVTRHKLAQMSALINAARWTVYSAADAFDRGRCDKKTAAAAKLTAAEAAMAATDEAVQLLGGYGYMTEYEVEHYYRDAKTLELFAGPPAVLKDAVSEGIIGKTR